MPPRAFHIAIVLCDNHMFPAATALHIENRYQVTLTLPNMRSFQRVCRGHQLLAAYSVLDFPTAPYKTQIEAGTKSTASTIRIVLYNAFMERLAGKNPVRPRVYVGSAHQNTRSCSTTKQQTRTQNAVPKQRYVCPSSALPSKNHIPGINAINGWLAASCCSLPGPQQSLSSFRFPASWQARMTHRINSSSIRKHRFS